MDTKNAVLLLQIVLQNLGALQAFASTIQKAYEGGGDITDEDLDRSIVSYRSAHATLDAFIGVARAPAQAEAPADAQAEKPAGEQQQVEAQPAASAPAAGEAQPGAAPAA